jgi:RNA polymerase sigma-70 factor (ECF subfamily)
MEVDWTRIHDGGYRWEVVEALMRHHAGAIMQHCTTWLGEGLAEEITQEVFVAAWEQLPRFRPVAPLRTWLFGIAHKKCQQAYRNRARRQAIARTFLDDIQHGMHTDPSLMPEGHAAQVSEHARLHASLAALRDEERILLTLRYWKELSVADIADIVGKSESAARKRLDRAVKRLRAQMLDVLSA